MPSGPGTELLVESIASSMEFLEEGGWLDVARDLPYAFRKMRML